MSYSQWESVNGTTLQIHPADVGNFIKLLVYSVDNLTTPSWQRAKLSISNRGKKKQQTQCIIPLDFTQNYHYVLQDEIQEYHWNKYQCTMHTVVIYFKKYGVLHHISLCIISDDLEQDTCFVHELQRIVTLYIRENLPQIKFVDNFSDSCTMHSKKYKAFLNLCHHK